MTFENIIGKEEMLVTSISLSSTDDLHSSKD